MTAEVPSQEGPETADTESRAVVPDEDGQYDLKGKFREALERKRAKQAQAAALAANTDASKIRAPTARPRASGRSGGRAGAESGPRQGSRSTDGPTGRAGTRCPAHH